MCIRDRNGPADPGRPAAGVGVRAAAGADAIGGGLRSGPVSYTHLRAHETVLDIVCRLLLEKKDIGRNPSAEGDYLDST